MTHEQANNFHPSGQGDRRWMAFFGYMLPLLLLSIGDFYRAPLVLLLWVLLINVPTLLANLLPKETLS